MVRTLAERMRAHEQQKARLAEQEAKLRDAERRVRTRRLIEAGGLVDKAGLLELDANALYGALLSLRDGADDKTQIDKWAALGGRTFAHEARLRDEDKEPIIVTFPAPLPRDATNALRAAGFRFSKVLRHWEGLARLADIDPIVVAHGGTARRVDAALGSPDDVPAADTTAATNADAEMSARAAE
jgi:Conjugal transfer protein TraD